MFSASVGIVSSELFPRNCFLGIVSPRIFLFQFAMFPLPFEFPLPFLGSGPVGDNDLWNHRIKRKKKEKPKILIPGEGTHMGIVKNFSKKKKKENKIFKKIFGPLRARVPRARARARTKSE